MAIVIDLQVATKQTDSAFARLEKALDRLEAVQKSLNQTLQATATYANQAAGAFGRMASGARSASQATQKMPAMRSPAAPPVQDPHQARTYASQLLSVDPNNRGALRMFNQAQRKINAADPQNALRIAMMRTRFTQGVFGNLIGHPLGIDLMKIGGMMGPHAAGGLFGGGGAGGGALATVGFAAAGAVAALGAFAAAVHGAGSALNALAAQTAVSSGDPGAVNAVRAAAAQLGMDPAQLASRVQGGVSSGFGGGFGAQAGINPVGGPFGDNDYARKAQKAIRYVANAGSFDQARRRAEGLGVPELAQFFFLNKSNKAALSNNGFGASTEGIAAGTNFRAAQERIASSFWKALDKATPAIEYFANGLSDLATMIDFVLNGFKKSPGGKSTQERQIQALDNNTRALNGMRETFGGGPRAQGALPGGLGAASFSNDFGAIKGLKLGAMGR